MVAKFKQIMKHRKWDATLSPLFVIALFLIGFIGSDDGCRLTVLFITIGYAWRMIKKMGPF